MTSGDCRMRAFNPPYWYFSIPMRLMLGVFKPRKSIQGLWFSGVVENVGPNVTKFVASHEIYARPQDLIFEANAEVICLPENAVIGAKPKNLSFE